jgi:quinol monooxygenase YgiN
MNIRLMAKFQIEHVDDRTAMQILSRLATAASLLPGCSGCTLVQTSDSASPLILVEEWESEEGIKRHISSEGFLAVLVQFGIGLHQSDQGSPGDKVTLRFARSQTALDLEDYTKLLANPDTTPSDD